MCSGGKQKKHVSLHVSGILLDLAIAVFWEVFKLVGLSYSFWEAALILLAFLIPYQSCKEEKAEFWSLSTSDRSCWAESEESPVCCNYSSILS